ncbi:MAG: dTDP-3-amino-3,6-dideoxy-alpha-D-galactopyranose 3-N-acetyltransferase [Chloroflexi bacterium ADurb.Bin360]|nr:MAG: dTDP-3-amino-3,6-dideoxy-alpha-D-galactopyranose 3-N-acetyltransferase [Chloroflexi bacterium ADurb.Bin360]
MRDKVRIHATAEVAESAQIGEGTSIWHQCQIRPDAQIGRNCIFGKGVYVDFGVKIGDNVKVQNYVSIYHGVEIEDGVFIGPHVCFTNDNLPRAINPDGTLKSADDWVLGRILIRRGAALGANSTILPKVVIGEWAMVGSGSVVSKDVPAYGLVYGNPARLHGFVCPCGQRLEAAGQDAETVHAHCSKCGAQIEIPLQTWRQAK